MAALRRCPHRRHENRKRDPTPMLILSRPAAGLALAAIAAGAYGYERLWPCNSSRPETPSRETPKPPPALRSLRDRGAHGAGCGRSSRTHDVGAAGRLRGLADQDLSRMLEAGAAARGRRSLHRPGAPGFQPDGSLAKPAKRVNPPSDPALKPHAKSVMAAVQNCNPLPVPTQYRPYYEQWRTETIHFNPRIAAR